jgi:prolyl-tRNA synthetase
LFGYYEKVKLAYLRIFKRCGLYPLYTLAGGGEFTMSNTNEFQIVSEVGEDEVLYCDKCRYSENIEISKLKQGDKCPKCGGKILKENAIEVGNIFPLGTKYSAAFGLGFTDERGVKTPVVMGSYGIGVSRLMGTAVETHNDDNGIIWPKELAPFSAHLIYLCSQDSKIKARADNIYEVLQKANIEVLYDDRESVSYGEKLKDADLIGIPVRVVVSERAAAQDSAEIKARNKSDVTLCSIKSLANSLRTLV